jgi:hypothetical protein
VRGLGWIVAVVGLVLVLVATGLIGSRDENETVTAGQWAQNVCGTVAVWRGQIEDIVDDVRNPPSRGSLGTEEPQSETPQGRTALVREGLERAVQATDSAIGGIERAGTPDTPAGEDAEQALADWANGAHDDLEEAQDALDEEADTPEEALEQFGAAAESLRTVATSGRQAIEDAVTSDTELAAAVRDASTCQELREETS